MTKVTADGTGIDVPDGVTVPKACGLRGLCYER